MAALVLYEPPWPVGGQLAGIGAVHRVEALTAQGDRDAALHLVDRLKCSDVVDPVISRTGAVTEANLSGCSGSVAASRISRGQVCTSDRHCGHSGLRAIAATSAGDCPPSRERPVAIASALPNATLVELPGQGHGALDLAPHLVAEAIRGFAGQAYLPGSSRPEPPSRPAP